MGSPFCSPWRSLPGKSPSFEYFLLNTPECNRESHGLFGHHGVSTMLLLPGRCAWLEARRLKKGGAFPFRARSEEA
jgi:hypothetical protein